MHFRPFMLYFSYEHVDEMYSVWLFLLFFLYMLTSVCPVVYILFKVYFIFLFTFFEIILRFWLFLAVSIDRIRIIKKGLFSHGKTKE